MNKNLYEKYLSSPINSKREKSYVWYTAIGLQEVDGLKTSKYLEEIILKNIDDDITFEEVSELISSYYDSNPTGDKDRTAEADKVAVKIAQILSTKSFVFSPITYINIHKQLFNEIYD